MRILRTLAIETSFDEAGFALIEASGGLKNPKFKVVKNILSSQIKIHRPFGGVVPNLAKQEHLKNLPILFKEIAGADPTHVARFMKSLDFITVTVGPGLEPALWTGIEFAKKLAKDYKKPLIGANHLEGHLYSFLLTQKDSVFPAIALIVSGAHTNLLCVESFSRWKRLGETRDDAAGEAFDKVARMLGLPYPGGPEIEKIARTGNPAAINFPRPMIHDKNCDFSFSGLKTAVLYYLRDNKNIKKKDVAASFQQAAIDVLATKTLRAAREYGAQSIILCGGVAANKALRGRIARISKEIGARFFVPDFKYNLDNAAMIGAAGYFAYLRKKKYPMRANGNLEI